LRHNIAGRALLAPVATIVLALVAIWYVARAVLLNLSLVRDGFERRRPPYHKQNRPRT